MATYSQVGGRFDSGETQVSLCRDYLASRAAMGWFEIATFVDAAYPGGEMNRPGVQALKRQIETGGAKVVLVYKLERILRCPDERSSFRAFLRKHGCKLISTTEDLCATPPCWR